MHAEINLASSNKDNTLIDSLGPFAFACSNIFTMAERYKKKAKDKEFFAFRGVILEKSVFSEFESNSL